MRQIDLIGENEQNRKPHLVVQHHLVQLFRCLAHAVAVVGIDHVDESLHSIFLPLTAQKVQLLCLVHLRPCVVMSPQWPKTVLAANILVKRKGGMA